MIGQALEAGEKLLAEEEARKALEMEREKVQESRVSDAEEQERLKTYKANLAEDARAEIREAALQKLRDMPGIKADYIVEPLVEAMENTIIRDSGVDLPPCPSAEPRGSVGEKS